MALINCPECDKQFSQYARSCPQCGFPNPLSDLTGKALSTRQSTGIQEIPDTDYIPAPRQINVVSEPRKTISYDREEKQYDNSLYGLFHGRTHFWFALCVYYLGGVVLLTMATVFVGQPQFMLWGVAGWAFVGLFVLLWNTKNLSHGAGKWLARILIVLILLVWINR
jgi:hypothetical protein